jgi:hypothetical protein
VVLSSDSPRRRDFVELDELLESRQVEVMVKKTNTELELEVMFQDERF